MLLSELPFHNASKIGELFIPPSAFEVHTSRSVRPIVTEFSGFTGIGGSATLVRYKGCPLICMTKHETFKGVPFEEAMEAVRIGSIKPVQFENLTFDEVIHTTNCDGEEFNDIIFARPNESDELYSSEYPYYFPLQKLKRLHTKAKFYFVGYPSSLSQNVLDADFSSKKYEFVKLLKECELDLEFKSHATHFNRYFYDDDGASLSGISGGAVFGFIKTEFGFEGFLSGIITRAGNGKLYTISANYLLTVFGH